MTQFDVLKQKHTNHTSENEAADQLKRILKEAEELQGQVEEKLQKITGLRGSLIIFRLTLLQKSICDDNSLLLLPVEGMRMTFWLCMFALVCLPNYL